MENCVRIGLMADTHGSLQALENSIAALENAGVDALVHLGDFCDSVQTKGLADIVRMLCRKRVFAVMGNNDYQVLNRLKNYSTDMTAKSRHLVLSYLTSTPVLRRMDHVCFAHSLPYDDIRSFYEPIDDGTTARAADVFSQTVDHILFCGHSHSPAVFTLNCGRVTQNAMGKRKNICFDAKKRYIVIVGAPSAGECGIFDRKRNCYERVFLRQRRDFSFDKPW